MTEENKEPEIKPDDVTELEEPNGDEINPVDLGEAEEPKGEPKEPEGEPKDFNWASLEEDLTKNGTISEDLIKQAKEFADPELVDEKVARLTAEYKLKDFEKYTEEKSKRNQIIGEMNTLIVDSFGGSDEFKTVSQTLRNNLDQGALDVINAKLTSGNKLLVQEGIKAAEAEYNKIKGIGGNLVMGDSAAPQEKELMLTKEEYRAIMRTEKYKTDPQYRQKMDDARLKARKADEAKYGPGTYYGYNQNGRYEL